MARVKVIEHGYFFKNNKLRTKCTCGCVYLTPRKKVRQHTKTNFQDYFYTDCPECIHCNEQNVTKLRKEMEGKDEKL